MNHKPVRLRPMLASDFASLAAWMVETPLWQRYGLTFERAVSAFERGAANEDWLIVAEVDGDVRGFAWVLRQGAFGRSPYLRLIGVRPDSTSGGVGALLLGEMERRAAEVADDLFLLVSDFNLQAQQFYKRQGYTQVGAIDGYVLPDVTELLFRKRLRSIK